MGWSGAVKPKGVTPREFILSESYTWRANDYRVVDHAVKAGALYVAVECMATGEVYASVTIYEHRNGMFYWKDMDETMGPNASECPVKILRQLTPLANESGNEFAVAWRARCYANAEARAAEKGFNNRHED
jgi:hypothetical protein